jgi:DNA-binding transcriptional regulator YdaS (Cro superfamily)
MKTNDFLDAIRARHALGSDYMVAKLMGVDSNYVSNWRSGRNTMGEDACMKVAELLEIRPGYVLACVAAERSKNDAVRAAWESVAASLAACVVAACGLAAPSPAAAWPGPAVGAVHIMSNRRRRERRQGWPIQGLRAVADVLFSRNNTIR